MPPRTLSLAAGLALLAGAAAAADPAPAGFTPLFNGKDLSGWHGWAVHAKGADPYSVAALSAEDRQKKVAEWTADAHKHWTVENGEVVNRGKGAYLATDGEYGDYEFRIEYKIEPTVDSGIYLKGVPQVQVWDPTDPRQVKNGNQKGSGGLWNNAAGSPGKDPLVKADNPPGEWNRFRILMVGERATIYLNDKLVVDHARLENYYDKASKKLPIRPLLPKAPVVLQTHPPEKEIRWRNAYVREIPPTEANQLLLSKAAEGFKPAFDGTSLTGWMGAVDDYEVRDGAVVCKPKRGGNLFTKDVYSDFSAVVEYKLPPGGNNGLLVRYPGTGDGSYTGMCEVQVLDDPDPRYAKIDPRQANGSVYGMIPAARGYLRPVGEWNVMQVTVQGPKIQVELNGSRVVDGDVSTVTEFMGTRPHPGKDRADGHFGFAGHSDPVAFRTVRIKSLK